MVEHTGGHDIVVWDDPAGYPAPMPEDEETVRIVVSLPASLRDEAAQAAAEDERSLAALIRFLLRQYVDQRRAG